MNYQVPSLTFLHRFKKAATVSVMAAGLFLSTSATAGLIPLELQDSPDIYSANIDVTYNGTTLVAKGEAQDYFDGTSLLPLTGNSDSFHLEAFINSSGVLSSGSLTILDGVTTLLMGNLTTLGFDTSIDPLEFLFDVTSGSLASAYGGIGATGGIILNDSGYSSFSTTFSNTGGGSADVGVAVPEPAGLLLISSGLLGLIVSRRRRSSK